MSRFGDHEKLRKQRFITHRIAPKLFLQGHEQLARTMFGSIQSLISNLVGDAGAECQSRDNDGRLATAALLLRVATVHSEMSKLRKEKLQAILKSCFALDDLEVAQLVDKAVEIDRVAVDLYHCARQLNKNVDDKGRRHIVKMMWEVVCSDGKVNALEDNIIWRAADLLEVSSRQRVELRQRVSTDRAVDLTRDNIGLSYPSPATVGN
jgi:uncharacterized tellurite resistance protein B-like protein